MTELDPEDYIAVVQAGLEHGLSCPPGPETEPVPLSDDERHNAWLMGFEHGQKLRRETEQAWADREAFFTEFVAPVVRATLEDMDATGVGTYEEKQARRKVAQADARAKAAEARAAAAQADPRNSTWPEEDDSLHTPARWPAELQSAGPEL